MKKLLIICGPTATGKTSLALKLAKKFNGQIISADSRQVYKDMNIGTGKDLPKNSKPKPDGHYLIKGIKLWGYDLVNPDQDFSLAHFTNFATPLIKKLQAQQQLPIIVGGTGLYLKALTSQLSGIHIPPNKTLRNKLEKLSIKTLQVRLKKINSTRFNQMNHSDQLNPRRLIRAIEIITSSQKAKKTKRIRSLGPDPFVSNNFWLGLKTGKKILDARIQQRVDQRLQNGAQAEVESLIKKGYSFNLPAMSAMGYRQWQPFFAQTQNLSQVKSAWIQAEKKYLRRQLTWFNNNQSIHWINISTPNIYPQVVRIITPWYTSN